MARFWRGKERDEPDPMQGMKENSPFSATPAPEEENEENEELTGLMEVEEEENSDMPGVFVSAPDEGEGEESGEEEEGSGMQFYLLCRDDAQKDLMGSRDKTGVWVIGDEHECWVKFRLASEKSYVTEMEVKLDLTKVVELQKQLREYMVWVVTQGRMGRQMDKDILDLQSRWMGTV